MSELRVSDERAPMTDHCEYCHERPREAVVIEPPEHHANLISQGIPPDPYSVRVMCRECSAGWPEVYAIEGVREAVMA